MCGSFRRAARALTQLYEEALRPLGLRATQMTVLQVLARVGEASQGQLGKILAIDSTTLTRTLAIMVREGWIKECRGDDRRERWLSLSKSGNRLLRRASPIWEKTQAQMRVKLGDQAWEELLQMTNQVATLATQGDSI
jgi:DNA-binding MarR family transcriptional regulator